MERDVGTECNRIIKWFGDEQRVWRRRYVMKIERSENDKEYVKFIKIGRKGK